VSPRANPLPAGDVTPHDVEKRVDKVAKQVRRGDDEFAHILEDALWRDTLTAIAENRCEYPDVCAEMALRTQALSFSRWCA